ncbi:DUF1493 family protein [Caballeronia sp. LZ065]|uniref:DUF1493 family protein n=1 Tax=Caballeronia sp. LZ065 TaxID=3038571 RepID=UPI002854E9D8|nr:DUF1493 family protein [Caballeronia sp. LZ065]MDR5780707.1 DUF1493 family protein [Caballeronia sp. LZ065]
MLKSLEAFVRKEACIAPGTPITPDMTIAIDLGQQGDDADIFMQRFFEAFDVNEGDYDFRRYFLMEGEGVLNRLITQFILRKRHSTTREPLTVGMLCEAIARGRWDAASLAAHAD